MEDYIIKLNNVSYAYEGNVFALKDINLSITKGEYICIIGQNGSGKSTLAKLLNGILLPTQGEVYINGLNTKTKKDLLKIRQAVGIIFQNPNNQIINSIVAEDIAFGPKNLGLELSQIDNKVKVALKSVEMLEFLNHDINTLSEGQKQRIAIAGVLAMNPSCIVFDEPTSMLDPISKKNIINIMKKLNRENNITIITITHNMDEAVCADRLIVMYQGNIKLIGAPKEIFKNIKILEDIGLDIPEIIYIVKELRLFGIDLKEDTITLEELKSELSRLGKI